MNRRAHFLDFLHHRITRFSATSPFTTASAKVGPPSTVAGYLAELNLIYPGVA
jgi:hypothetical protein